MLLSKNPHEGHLNLFNFSSSSQYFNLHYGKLLSLLFIYSSLPIHFYTDYFFYFPTDSTNILLPKVSPISYVLPTFFPIPLHSIFIVPLTFSQPKQLVVLIILVLIVIVIILATIIVTNIPSPKSSFLILQSNYYAKH